MGFRLATLYDLQDLNKMYQSVIDFMLYNDIDIWDIFDPRKFFYDDIVAKRLYILEENDYILGSFTMFEDTFGAKYIDWLSKEVLPVYISRLAVNPKFREKGVGSLLLEYATSLAKEKGYGAIRLLVVDYNEPAIEFYSKNGFVKAEGVYYDEVTDDITFNEFGYEFNI